MASGLLELSGVGPASGAQVLISYSPPDRCVRQAAFAAWAAANPIPASSVTSTRHRLNHHGGPQLNRVPYMIARSRTEYDPTTIAYVGRRTAEANTLREIRRCVKRFMAR
ncbi:transposase [Paeniglutamicibacter cryotolerans]|uniref:transposase n=1 Tax=Paeniglutamicibacter cryotolerans TaxID=670079 RepID=UPI003382A8AE